MFKAMILSMKFLHVPSGATKSRRMMLSTPEKVSLSVHSLNQRGRSLSRYFDVDFRFITNPPASSERRIMLVLGPETHWRTNSTSLFRDAAVVM